MILYTSELKITVIASRGEIKICKLRARKTFLQEENLVKSKKVGMKKIEIS